MTVHSSPERPERGDRGDRAGDKRERILAAAERIFARHGFFAARVSEIARVAGVADGTIYLYFKSKDDLLISLFEDRMEQVNENLRAALGGEDPPVERLRRALERHFELVQEHPQLAEVLTVELRQSSKFLKEYQPSKFGEFLKLIAGAIEEGQRAGIIRGNVDAPLAARAIFGAVDELALAWVLGPRSGKAQGKARGNGRAASNRGALELGKAADQLVTLFIEGLRE